MLTEAPLRSDLTDGPTDGEAVWANTADNRRLRLGVYRSPGAQGTVLLFPGRTEYIEKYGLTATDLVSRGYSVLVIDWRGQGMADRLVGNALVGHVDRFSDYQLDVDTMLASAEKLGLPRPWHLLAHSMGGCIGLRALMRKIPVQSASFSGPMWGIRLNAFARPAAWALSGLGVRSGYGHVNVPGTKLESYVAVQPFSGNLLTSNKEMFDMMRRQAQAEPLFQLGGPSLRWLNEALAETYALAQMPAPDLPCLTALGQHERIVDPGRIRSRMQGWRNGHLITIPNGEHEVLMEGPAVRACVIDAMTALFEGRPITPCDTAISA